MSSHLSLLSNLTASKSTPIIHQHKYHLTFHHQPFSNSSSLCNESFDATAFTTPNYVDRLKWVLQCDTTNSDYSNSDLIRTQENLEDEEEVKGKIEVYRQFSKEREVICEVEKVSWRERRIKAEITVKADIHSVWNSLTDYERLADFIPNLASCERIPCPYPGRIWLEQRGLQRALYWNIEARVLLDLQEIFYSEDEREIQFSMVEGDFKKFEGKWFLKSDMRSQETSLSYEVRVVPKFNIPVILLEKVIRSELPVNLQAVAHRAESQSGQ